MKSLKLGRILRRKWVFRVDIKDWSVLGFLKKDVVLEIFGENWVFLSGSFEKFGVKIEVF
jgi:hypothetical protein